MISITEFDSVGLSLNLGGPTEVLVVSKTTVKLRYLMVGYID